MFEVDANKTEEGLPHLNVGGRLLPSSGLFFLPVYRPVQLAVEVVLVVFVGIFFVLFRLAGLSVHERVGFFVLAGLLILFVA